MLLTVPRSIVWEKKATKRLTWCGIPKLILMQGRKGVKERGKGPQVPGLQITMGAPNDCRGRRKSPYNVTSTFFNTVHFLSKDLRFELVKCQTRFLPLALSNLVTFQYGWPDYEHYFCSSIFYRLFCRLHPTIFSECTSVNDLVSDRSVLFEPNTRITVQRSFLFTMVHIKNNFSNLFVPVFFL